jgi:hypothetical protein
LGFFASGADNRQETVQMMETMVLKALTALKPDEQTETQYSNLRERNDG